MPKFETVSKDVEAVPVAVKFPPIKALPPTARGTVNEEVATPRYPELLTNNLVAPVGESRNCR